MLYIGTKIVVIGSNVKRKAGPRTGSIGYVLYITDMPIIDKHANVVMFDAQILFSCFGFQKRERYEVQRVRIVMPRMHAVEADVTKTYAATTKYLKQQEENKHLQHIMVCPLNWTERSELPYKMFSLLQNNNIRSKLERIYYKHASKDFPHTAKLYNMLSVEALLMLKNVLPHQKISRTMYLLKTTPTEILEEVLLFITRLNSLQEIVEKRRKSPRKFDIELQVVDTIFKPYEFLNTAKLVKRYTSNEYLKQCTDMSAQFSIEVSKVISKRA